MSLAASVVCTHHHVALEVQGARPAELHRRVTDAHHRGSGDQTRSHGTSCLTGGKALKHGKTPGFSFGSIECLAWVTQQLWKKWEIWPTNPRLAESMRACGRVNNWCKLPQLKQKHAEASHVRLQLHYYTSRKGFQTGRAFWEFLRKPQPHMLRTWFVLPYFLMLTRPSLKDGIRKLLSSDYFLAMQKHSFRPGDLGSIRKKGQHQGPTAPLAEARKSSKAKAVRPVVWGLLWLNPWCWPYG